MGKLADLLVMAKFRETKWFKHGYEVPAPADDAVPQNVERPIEDRYLDDGTVSHTDVTEFSVRTGGTQYMARLDNEPDPDDSMPTLIAELKHGRRPVIAVIGVGVAAICTMLVAYAF